MDVTLGQIRAARKKQQPYFKGSADWRLSDWVVALAGEVGEAANIVKKINRGDFTLDEKRKDLADELADVLIYLDAVAAAAGIDMAEAVTRKFNIVSARVASPVRLRPLPPCVTALLREREKQVDKGFDAEHDGTHAKGELVNAAAHAVQADGRDPISSPWPFVESPTVHEKPVERRLEIALGLLGAEYDRKHRANGKDVVTIKVVPAASARPAVKDEPAPLVSPSTWFMVKHDANNRDEALAIEHAAERASIMAGVPTSRNLGDISTARAVELFGEAVGAEWSRGGIRTRANIIRRLGISSPGRVWVDLDTYPEALLSTLATCIQEHPRVCWLLTTSRPALMRERPGCLLDAIKTYAWLGTVFSNQEEAEDRLPQLYSVYARHHFVVFVPNSPVDIRHKCVWKFGGMGAKGVLGFLPDRDEPDDYVFSEKEHALDWAVVDTKFPGLSGKATDVSNAKSFITDCAVTGVPCYVDFKDSLPKVELPR
jgi:NTP pyrophosphatase (non-canonical NTP hydrolase)